MTGIVARAGLGILALVTFSVTGGGAAAFGAGPDLAGREMTSGARPAGQLKPHPQFAVADPAIWQHLQATDGWELVGEPLSRAFKLHGRTSQLFAQALLQVDEAGGVETWDLFGEGLGGFSDSLGRLSPGDLFKQVLLGGPQLPEIRPLFQGSPYWAQYDVTTGQGPLRSDALPDTDLRAAFIPGRLGDPRFGVIVTGSQGADSRYVAAALEGLGATAWFTYDGSVGVTNEQVALVRPGADLSQIAHRAQMHPGTTWLVGNEPNVPGQDDMSPAAYADFLWGVAEAVRLADPTAMLVGPNVLNWDTTCVACPGFTSGRAWSEILLATYTARYGPLPLDAWGIHTYNLNWSRLPMVDAAADQVELTAARDWLDGRGLSIAIWLTEFGVVWGYEGLEWVPTDGGWIAQPRGAFRVDLLHRYLDEMFGWLTEAGNELQIERWFLYGTSPPPEPYAQVPAGIALVDPAAPTRTALGDRYRLWALG